jgi:hypothetical protein
MKETCGDPKTTRSTNCCDHLMRPTKNSVENTSVALLLKRPSNQLHKGVEVFTLLLGDPLTTPKPPVDQRAIGRWHQELSPRGTQHGEPDLLRKHAANQQVVNRFWVLITESTGPTVSEVVPLQPADRESPARRKTYMQAAPMLCLAPWHQEFNHLVKNIMKLEL